MPLWILITIGAVLMQSVRTAGQKHLTSDLDAVGATMTRFLFGLPFVAVMMALVLVFRDDPIPQLGASYLATAFAAAVLQIAATVLLIHLFSLRNFAVGTTFARTEAFLTAVIGATIFGELITGMGWLAIVISVFGVVLLTIAGNRRAGRVGLSAFTDQSAIIGLGSGLCFALCSLLIRSASLSLGGSWITSAVTTLLVMVAMQTVMMGIWLGFKDRSQFAGMGKRWPLCVFVGATSALGSAGWFAAVTLERASYVKALGQTEFIVALLISGAFFRERTTWLELVGMISVGVGVLILVLYG